MANAYDWECVAPIGCGCGEGVVWAEDEQALYWTDVTRFLIHRWDGRDKGVRSWLFDEPVAALSCTERSGRLLVALGSRLILWTAATDERRECGVRLDGWPHVRFNEGRTGPDGRFWLGSMRNNVNADGSLRDAGGADGVLMCIDADGRATVQATGLGIANTLCWSPDGATMIFGDTLANALYQTEYGAGAVSDRRPFFCGFDRGGPDGSAIDADGHVWNCRFGGGCIVRIGPEGALDRIVEAPVRNPTTCAFGGPDYRTLFVASAGILTDPADRLAGSLFALRVEAPGLPSFRFCTGAS